MKYKDPSWSQVTDRAARRKLWNVEEQQEKMKAELEMV